MLFNFQDFINSLRENPEKKDIVSKYEKYVEQLPEKVEDCIWFKEYVSKFKTLDIKVPEDLKEEFDWELLQKLVASSFSSEALLEKTEDGIEFVITVHSWDKSVVKKISELWGFQILRLYEIYIEEQLNLQILMNEDEKEKDIIESQRVANLERWKIILDNLEAKELKEKEEKEKEEQLDDLLKQL